MSNLTSPVTCCQSLSSCKSVMAYIPCFTTIYEDETKELTIQLFDKNRLALNLDNYDAFEVYVYDERDVVAGKYRYPFQSDRNEMQILQENYTDGIIMNQGKFLIKVDPSVTGFAINGNLFAEIILYKNVSGGGYEKTVISCLKILHLKESMAVFDKMNSINTNYKIKY